MSVLSPLRIARERTGLSREKVAAQLDISSKTVERWEKGTQKRRIKRSYLKQLADLYEVTLEELER